jgi:hypothetical protein
MSLSAATAASANEKCPKYEEPLVASQPYRAYAQKNERLLTVVNGRVAVRGQQAKRGRITMTDRYMKTVLTVIAGALGLYGDR